MASAPQSKQLGKDSRAAFADRKKISPYYQIVRWERVKVSESRTLARKMGVGKGAWSGKSQLHNEGRQVPSRREMVKQSKPL